MFFNSGAEAVENAVKIARAVTRRPAVIAFEGAFHGRTYMAMTLTSKPKPYKSGMGPLMPEVYRAPYPDPYRRPPGLDDDAFLGGVERLFETQVAPEDVAAVVVEPILGEGGFVVPPQGFLRRLRELTERYGILLVCDEVQSGFGRTGSFFACEHEGIVPDLITVAKSIAAGLPLSGVLGRRDLMDAVAPGMLGGTFVGNPLALAAAHAVLDVFEAEDVLGEARRQGEVLRRALEPLLETSAVVGDVRGRGAMVAVEFVRDKGTKEPNPEAVGRVIERAFKAGVLVMRAGIHGNVVRFLAPLTTPVEVLEEGLEVVVAAIRAEG
jgi:4-aminobutyrate aminotransferase/(S)-3-amino-2-methylpropionate transaminase